MKLVESMFHDSKETDDDWGLDHIWGVHSLENNPSNNADQPRYDTNQFDTHMHSAKAWDIDDSVWD